MIPRVIHPPEAAMESPTHRHRELARAPRELPAALYNQARALLARSPHGSLFIPIRPLQYLAVVETEEILFVAVQHDDRVEVVWELPPARERTDLEAPLLCQEVVLHADGLVQRERLAAEFHLALREEAWRQRPDAPGRVLAFKPRQA